MNNDELTEEELAAWPKCAVPACKNKCCLRLQSKYCWPHTPKVDTFEVAMNILENEPDMLRRILNASFYNAR